MRLDELISSLGKWAYKGEEKKEVKALAKSVEPLYKRVMQAYKKVQRENPEAFKTQPEEAFEQWFSHVFQNVRNRTLGAPKNILNNQTVDDLVKPFILLAILNKETRAKTAVHAADTLRKVAPMIDDKMSKAVEKHFKQFFTDKGPQQKVEVPDDEDLNI